MEQTTGLHYLPSHHIAAVMDQIIRMCRPNQIYLYNQRVGMKGDTTSFKLCVIAPGDTRSLEHDIYVGIDCDVPFDVLIYTPQEWNALSLKQDTFASKIAQTGVRIYG